MMDETLQYTIDERRICWPKPDATCLHGGCSWCNDHPFRKLSTIQRYARGAGVLPHRGRGEEDALHAYQYGLGREFHNVEVRTSRENVTAYAESIGVLALKAMATGMPGGTHGRKRAEVLAWLLRHRRNVLDESFRRSYRTAQAREVEKR